MIKRILPHINIIMCLMFCVFLILNLRNPMMGFISGEISLWLLAILVVISLINAVTLVLHNAKKDSCSESDKT